MARDVKPVRKARLASCLVFRNEVVSFGFNQLKTHPFQAKFSKNDESIYLHAEIDCIKNALKVLTLDEVKKSSLYVCRIKWENTLRRRFVWGNSCPCLGCMKAIASFGIQRVIYSDNENGVKIL